MLVSHTEDHITPVEGAEQPTKADETPTKAKAVPKAVEPLEAEQAVHDKPVDVKKVAAKAKDDSVSLIKEAPKMLTQTDVVKAMWDAALGGDSHKAQELLDFKKKAKKGWAVWGLPTTAGDTLKSLLEKLKRFFLDIPLATAHRVHSSYL